MDYTRYTMFDDPIPYKNLLIYPVKLRDYRKFEFYFSCCVLEKNSISNNPELAVKAISMTYLDYLYHISNEENKLMYLLDGLLRLVLNDDDADIRQMKKDTGSYFEIRGQKFFSEEFNEIRNILAEQNLVELPDEKIQKSVRNALEEARRFKQKINKTRPAPFEEQMIALSLYSGLPLESIYNMTLRKFILSIQRANHMIMSDIYLNASMSGFVKFKNKDVLRGWLADIKDDDKYGDVTMGLDSITKKISGEEAKENKK